MNFTFETQGTNTYLVYAVDAEDTIDTMSLGMLTNNNIPGIAHAIFTQMDANKFIKYNVSAHISVKQFFSGPVNQKRLVGVFTGIVNAMLSAEEINNTNLCKRFINGRSNFNQFIHQCVNLRDCINMFACIVA